MEIIKSSSYNIVLGPEVFKSINSFLKTKKYSSYFILCDENTLSNCLPQLITSCTELKTAEIIEIEAGEISKSIDFSSHILQTLIENRADKNSLFINLGGGVVSDLGGFTASVYKRGIDFINIPTSLLAMADASVGGKTGIDFHHLKNVIGSFAQPQAVFIYPKYLDSLPERHYLNGLVEIYKIALVSNQKFWMTLKNNPNNETLVLKSVQLKNKIVKQDPFDKGLRKILNFGHTFGHALETFFLETPKELLHGEAILAGMILESHLALQKKLISKTILNDIVTTLKLRFVIPDISNCPLSHLVELMGNDKKTVSNKFKFSLINSIGSCKFDVDVSLSQIEKAFQYYSGLKND